MNGNENAPAAGAGAAAFALGAAPAIRLYGKVNEDMLRSFFEQLDAAHYRAGPLVIELATEGGDADIGRRLALEVRLLRESRALRGEPSDAGRVVFLGKTIVYSAGVSMMSAFARADRYLTRDAVLLIHERRLDKTVHFSGALRATLAMARDLVAEMENGQRLQREGFTHLIAGSDIGIDELMRQVETANWYLSADEALRRGLVAALV